MERITVIMFTVLCASGTVAKATNQSLASSGDGNRNLYLDMRKRIDHLEERLDSATCKLEKQQTEIREKLHSFETLLDAKMEILELKLQESVRLEVEFQRSELASQTEVSAPISNQNETKTPFCNVNTTFESKLEQIFQRADACIRVAEIIKDRNVSKGAPNLDLASPHEWIVILRRVTGRVNFSRDWDEYKSGFGDLGGEFWLGLEDIHQLTSRRSHRLRVMLTDFSGEVKFAEYTDFLVRGEGANYRLHVTGYVKGSTAGDSLTFHNGKDFSTQDRDNDKHNSKCASNQRGGWWYHNCAYSRLTGKYLPAGDMTNTGIKWYYAYNDVRSFKAAEMSIREA